MTVKGLELSVSEQLWEAVRKNNLARVEHLLLRGADINDRDEDGMTLLMAATLNADTDMAQLLIDKGIDIDATDNDGYTALRYCFALNMWDKTEVLRVLIDNFADITIADTEGETPLDIANKSSRFHLLDLLEAAPQRRQFLRDVCHAEALKAAPIEAFKASHRIATKNQLLQAANASAYRVKRRPQP